MRRLIVVGLLVALAASTAGRSAPADTVEELRAKRACWIPEPPPPFF